MMTDELLKAGNELADAADTINEAHADGATPDEAAWKRLGDALTAWWKATGQP